MKKVLFLMLAVVLSSPPAKGQEMEILDSISIAPDPMYGNKGKTVWRSEHMEFILNEDNTLEWQLRNPPHIFISDRSKWNGDYLGYSNARVGLFADNDSLLAMVDKWRAFPSEHGTILKMSANATFDRPDGTKTKGTIAHVYGTLLKRKGSYVRVVCNVYGDYYYEVKAKMK